MLLIQAGASFLKRSKLETHTLTHCYASDQNHAVQHYLCVIVLKINHDILATKSTKQAVDCLFVMWQTVKRNVTRFTRLFCCLCPAMYVEYWVALESETRQIVTEILRQTLKNTFFFSKPFEIFCSTAQLYSAVCNV